MNVALYYAIGGGGALAGLAVLTLVYTSVRALRRASVRAWAHRTGDAERAQATALEQQRASRRVPTSSNTPPLPTAWVATRPSTPAGDSRNPEPLSPAGHHHGKKTAA